MNTSENAEFLPCPFCGDAPENAHNDIQLDFVRCSNQDCDLHDAEIQEDYWNTRPQPAPLPTVTEDGAVGLIVARIVEDLKKKYPEWVSSGTPCEFDRIVARSAISALRTKYPNGFTWGA